MATKKIGEKIEPKTIKEKTLEELRSDLAAKKHRYKIASANYEFHYAPMLLEDIREIQREIKKRMKKVS